MSGAEAGAVDQGLDIGGLWWRAQRYELRDGLIRPEAGADIQPYDPWRAYARKPGGEHAGSGASAPYAALLELAWRVRLFPPADRRNLRLTSESEALVLEWCAAHGLLGVLLQEAEALYYAARWRNATLDEAEGRHEGVLQPVRKTYTWTGSAWEVAGWTERLEPWSLPAVTPYRVPFDNDEGVYEGTVVPAELVGPRWQPEILLRSHVDGTYSRRALGLACAPFFPHVPMENSSTHEYPAPGSEHWWLEYAEPVDAFLDAAMLFFNALTTLEPGSDPGEPWYVRHGSAPTAGQQALHALLQGVRPMLYRAPEGGDWQGGWRAKSLLSSYAVMAYLDLLDGKQILACDICGKPYVSGAYQARYCSERCRNTALKRAYRARTRQRRNQASPPSTRGEHALGD